jgi:hypothetical protein
MYPKEFSIGNEVFPYSEIIHGTEDKYDYYYEISISWQEKTGVVIVTRWGVSIYFDNGKAIMTNIQPYFLFKGKKSLDEDNLRKILNIICNTDAEGKSITKEDLDYFYRIRN